MFEKILIANRGEIACRVIKTARKMGIQTVAVYSEVDSDALHVRLADEAVHIGKAPAAKSYLRQDLIIDACHTTGAQAVHPGYGFLSENAEFCETLEKAGIVFIGPAPHAVQIMGDKIASKKLAKEAGVNTIPGYAGVIKDKQHAVTIAGEIGYPVMLKASAGGGGKGMRIASNDRECREGFERAQNEALASFGDNRLLIEKFIEEPRHIEIQIMADAYGNTIYLGERECSIQRRHQKIIEEAPSPFLDAETRKSMGEQAVTLARAVQYKSAGTVEFIVDQNRHFYFLEMNTRLQVEHPVTELITGLDLVELMIRTAAGNPLPLDQEEVQLNGWALETRIYAEDPFRDFLPSSGRLIKYQPPAETRTVRVDTGVYEGGEVSIYYDPMIAKLVTHGIDRRQAISGMREALNEYYIRGVRHNIGFLGALVGHNRFQAGHLSTNFIADEFPDGFHSGEKSSEHFDQAIVVAAVIHRNYMDRAARLSGQLSGHERRVNDDWSVFADGGNHMVVVRPMSTEYGYQVEYNGQIFVMITDWTMGQPLLRGTINNHSICFQIGRRGLWYRLHNDGIRVDTMVMTPQAAHLYALMPEKELADKKGFLLAPMPGLLVKISVQEGQEVKAGEELAVIEAMKMENVLRAEQDSVIAGVKAKLGDCVEVDQVIIEFQ